ncbi:uncharacterized protein B0H64DRAFT_243618 [Chaetomium fimeti]|uniref:BTB domain-containing protein n=1 Tax=Chaetomium fimeti TaxID=1854472 RepID=A0AAE0H8N1_9PEZI|nr:hypothetical protein B0H64DRAFT_243618 [Chaetomium fimeti]
MASRVVQREDRAYPAYKDAGFLFDPSFDKKSTFKDPIVIDEEGDLWIEVGGGCDREPTKCEGVCRFRVRSQAMREFSSLWQTLVATARKSQEPGKELVVRLPKDEPLAIAALVAVCHQRVDLLPRWPNHVPRHERISRLLSAADKYGMVGAFRQDFRPDWMSHGRPLPYAESKGDPAGTLHRLNVAWQLECVQLVEETAWMIMCHATKAEVDELVRLTDRGDEIGLPFRLGDLMGVIANSRRQLIQCGLGCFQKGMEEYEKRDWYTNMGPLLDWSQTALARPIDRYAEQRAPLWEGHLSRLDLNGDDIERMGGEPVKLLM